MASGYFEQLLFLCRPFDQRQDVDGSDVDVVSADEGRLFILGDLDLNAIVVQVEAASEYGVSLSQYSLLLAIETGLKRDVATEGILVIGEGPHMDVVHFFDTFDTGETLIHLLD